MERAYEGEQDLRRMESLVRALWERRGPHVACTAGDLQWRMNRNNLVRPDDIRLWATDDGELVGFAWRYVNGDVDVIAEPAHARTIAAACVGWAERFAGPRPSYWALESDSALREGFVAAGLAMHSGCYVHFAGALDGLDLAPSLPECFVVRGTRVDEIEMRAAVHRAAFGSERLQASVYRRLIASRLYRGTFDVVAVAPTGALAAFALGWFDPETGTAELEPVGVAPAWRRRGLARAVCTEALRRMREAGASTGVVYAHAEDPITPRLTASLGLRVVDRNLGYARPA